MPRFDHTRAKTARARDLRSSMTDAEARLWSCLRRSEMHGVAFRRQPMGSYVLDFFSPSAKLAIEVDGGQHNENSHARRDAERDQWFAARGIRTLRFWNIDIFRNLEGVLETIWQAVDSTSPSKAEVGAQRREGVESILQMSQSIDRTPSPTLPLSGGGEKTEFLS